VIAKSTVIKGRGGKSGGCAVKAVGLTSGDLHCVSANGPGTAGSTDTRWIQICCCCRLLVVIANSNQPRTGGNLGQTRSVMLRFRFSLDGLTEGQNS